MSSSGTSAHLEAFWTRYFRLGFSILGAECAVAIVYFLLTSSGERRVVLVSIASVSAAVSVGALPFVRRIATRSWRVQFSLASTLLSSVALTVCAGLDGGIDSHLLYLAVLPMISAALALPTWAVTTSGACTLAEFVALTVTDRNVTSGSSSLVILYAVTVGVVILAIASAINRERLQENEDIDFARVSELADTDPLTGCVNHRVFDRTLRAEVDRSIRLSQPLSLIVADVDHFKDFNDHYGHPKGDAALIAVAQVLAEAVRSSDTVARIGGDEFAVILPSAPAAQAVTVTDRIRSILVDRREIGVTLSLGIAEIESGDPTPTKLFTDADADLYRDKSDRRRLKSVSF
jgi:diguanylate cyclase (GGDEF)-like protein